MIHKIGYTEPNKITETLKDEGWKRVMEEQIDNYSEINTCSLVLYTPNLHVLNCKWVFRTKLNADGTLDNKARLVKKGFDQEEEIDYLETYIPVVRIAMVKLVLHVATIMQWELKQMNVKNAFLHGDLLWDVYMTRPAGFVYKSKPNHVCKLHKAIYGLKQSPRALFDKFSNFLLEFGFICSKPDPSFFICVSNNDIISCMLMTW